MISPRFCRSERTACATPGYWTFTATSRPSCRRGAVDLADRRRGHASSSNSAKTSSSGSLELGLDHLAHVLEGHPRRGVAQLGQLRLDALLELLGEGAGVDERGHLADLHRRALHVPEHLEDLLGGLGLAPRRGLAPASSPRVEVGGLGGVVARGLAAGQPGDLRGAADAAGRDRAVLLASHASRVRCAAVRLGRPSTRGDGPAGRGARRRRVTPLSEPGEGGLGELLRRRAPLSRRCAPGGRRPGDGGAAAADHRPGQDRLHRAQLPLARGGGRASTRPSTPTFFAKFANALAAPGADGGRCRATSSKVDYEAEVAFVIGDRCKDVAEDEALEHVAGYMLLNDLSARDLSSRPRSGCRARSSTARRRAARRWSPPTRPGRTTRSRSRCTLNGEEMQRGDHRRPGALGAGAGGAPSKLMTLEPGDIVVHRHARRRRQPARAAGVAQARRRGRDQLAAAGRAAHRTLG